LSIYIYRLAEEAGLKERAAVAPRAQTPRSKKTETARKLPYTQDAGKQRPASHGADTTAIPFEGGIVLVLPTKVLSNPELIGDYKDVLTAINTFVSKCETFLKATPNSDDGE
jgi:hypothetical protein